MATVTQTFLKQIFFLAEIYKVALSNIQSYFCEIVLYNQTQLGLKFKYSNRLL